MTELADLIRQNAAATAPGRRYYADRARDTVTDLLQFSAGLGDSFNAIRTLHDPNLSPDGIEAAKKAKNDDLVGRIRMVAKNAQNDVDYALREAEKATEPHRPKFDPDNVAQVVRTEQAWSTIIRPQREGGKAWADIIPILDHDGILAIDRFAEAHETGKRRKEDRHEVPGVMAHIRSEAEKRIRDLAPEGAARETFDELVDVRKFHRAGTISAQALAGIRDGRDVITAHLAVQAQAYEVGANPAAVQQAQAAPAAA